MRKKEFYGVLEEEKETNGWGRHEFRKRSTKSRTESDALRDLTLFPSINSSIVLTQKTSAQNHNRIYIL